MRVQVVVVHSHRIVAEGLGAFLAAQPTIDVIGAVVSARAALAMLQRAVSRGGRPVLVIEARLLTTAEQAPGPPRRGSLAATSVGGGRSRMVGSDASGATLIGTVLDIAGEPVPDTQTSHGSSSPWPAPLTEREFEVLRLVTRGYSDGEIAAHLSISVRTASHHVAAIIQKLGATSRLRAALHAVKEGLIRIDDLP